ncbi:MAG TPA: hypothetical protein VE715_19290, partial [Blastocatellia bacterium]|nr:hypothetical protein [Blastocatellia bacterium]
GKLFPISETTFLPGKAPKISPDYPPLSKQSRANERKTRKNNLRVLRYTQISPKRPATNPAPICFNRLFNISRAAPLAPFFVRQTAFIAHPGFLDSIGAAPVSLN